MNEKNDYQTNIYGNRLVKKYKKLRKWARKSRITCYRLYNKDIPEIPISVDLYEFLPQEITSPIEAARFMQKETSETSLNLPHVDDSKRTRLFVKIYLYERPYKKEITEESEWLKNIANKTAEILNIETSHIITQMRKHDKGGSQYSEQTLHDTMSENTLAISGIVQEEGQLFTVNLTNKIDTGLFFDHRPLRHSIREKASGKSILNLFCYTASFSIYAATGRAKYVESVDLSNTYLAIAKKNMILNGFNDDKKYPFIKSDVFSFLEKKLSEKPILSLEKNSESINRYDLIILDPPTFSNSKSMQNTLDINKDYAKLINNCIDLLKQKGILYFSTNSKRFSLDKKALKKESDSGFSVQITDCTQNSFSEDFKNSKPHKLWKIQVI